MAEPPRMLEDPASHWRRIETRPAPRTQSTKQKLQQQRATTVDSLMAQQQPKIARRQPHRVDKQMSSNIGSHRNNIMVRLSARRHTAPVKPRCKSKEDGAVAPLSRLRLQWTPSKRRSDRVHHQQREALDMVSRSHHNTTTWSGRALDLAAACRWDSTMSRRSSSCCWPVLTMMEKTSAPSPSHGAGRVAAVEDASRVRGRRRKLIYPSARRYHKNKKGQDPPAARSTSSMRVRFDDPLANSLQRGTANTARSCLTTSWSAKPSGGGFAGLADPMMAPADDRAPGRRVKPQGA